MLPVYHYKDELMQAVRENRVVVVRGETGSGKTTQFPQYLRDGKQGLVSHAPKGMVELVE